MRHNWQPPNMNKLNFLNTPGHNLCDQLPKIKKIRLYKFCNKLLFLNYSL